MLIENLSAINIAVVTMEKNQNTASYEGLYGGLFMVQVQLMWYSET